MGTKKTGRGLLLITLVIMLAGLGVWFALRQRSAGDIKHVVLISLDTTRADYLSCYGYERKTTPNIDALASNGYLFSNTITPIPLTLPAHTSMLTGTIPPHHGKHENKDPYFDESHVTLAQLLKKKGYSTGAFIGAQILNGSFGLDRGFDTYHDEYADKDASERRGEDVNRVAFEWLEKQKDDPVFLFLHYYDPHDDYDPPEPFASKFKDSPYAGEIAYTDYCIGKVIDKLKKLDMYDSSLIIVTADHGEMLGEHGEITHMFFVYESAIKVPMIYKLPGSNSPQRIDDIAGIIDIVPTVCDLVGIETPTPIQGMNLAGYFRNNPPKFQDRQLYCESLYPTNYKANSLLSLVSNRWKYIQTTRPELYDLQNDPDEQINLVESQAKRARILKDRLAQILAKTVRQEKAHGDTPLNPEALKHLRSLGYLASGNIKEDFSFDQSAEDPKDLIDLHNGLTKASKMEKLGKFADARSLVRRLLKQYSVYSLYELGSRAALKQKDYREAIFYGEKAIALEPDRFRVHYNLGLAYSRNKQYKEAIGHFEQALEFVPKDHSFFQIEGSQMLNSLAWLLVTCPDQALQDPSKAMKLSRQACDLTLWKNPICINTLAVAYAKLDNLSEAVKTSEKAVASAQAIGMNQAHVAKLQEQLDLFKKALVELKKDEKKNSK